MKQLIAIQELTKKASKVKTLKIVVLDIKA